MLTIVFVAFIAMFAIAGIFISLEAKRRGDGSVPGPRNERPSMRRATSDAD